MKIINKIAETYLVLFTIVIMLLAVIWLEGFYYFRNVIAYFAGLTLLIQFISLLASKYNFEQIKQEESQEGDEFMEREVLNTNSKKVVLTNYYLHQVDSELKEFNDEEASRILKKAKNQLKTITEETSETKELEEKIKTYENIINLRNRLK